MAASLPAPVSADGWRLFGHEERLGLWLALLARGLWSPAAGWRAVATQPSVEAGARRAGVTEAEARELAARLRAAGAAGVTAFDPGYPERLRDLFGLDRSLWPPPFLSVRGRLPVGPAVAVVGSRRADGYGLRMAERLARGLAASGVAVVSGLARGVDRAAHEGALAAGGATVAVLGSGLARPYPPEHAALADRIAEAGAVVSEFPLDFEPKPYAFPLRNRVIAALSDCVVVVEAGERSGALGTAGHASDLGRAVAAVPGDVDRALSRGANRLLRDGAHVVLDCDDVRALVPAGAAKGARASEAEAGPSPPPVEPGLRAVWRALSLRAQGADELLRATGLPLTELLLSLTELELRGLARREGDGWARREG
ncbi:MAG: DNA-protecting protein DprA [Clostridia bacterium]|nr:DNA-protecting protein DprA [Clostridia bacterium]